MSQRKRPKRAWTGVRYVFDRGHRQDWWMNLLRYRQPNGTSAVRVTITPLPARRRKGGQAR